MSALEYHLTDLFLGVDEVETISREDEEVIVGLDLVVVGFGLWDEVLFVLNVTDGSANS